MKGAEEDIAGNYFKPVRANRLMAQAQETQRAVSKFKGWYHFWHEGHEVKNGYFLSCKWNKKSSQNQMAVEWIKDLQRGAKV